MLKDDSVSGGATTNGNECPDYPLFKIFLAILVPTILMMVLATAFLSR